jgi:hypothetical protein
MVRPRVHVTVITTAHVDPPFSAKKLKKQELTLLNFAHVQDVCALERKRA